jgi:hypothetical protein
VRAEGAVAVVVEVVGSEVEVTRSENVRAELEVKGAEEVEKRFSTVGKTVEAVEVVEVVAIGAVEDIRSCSGLREGGLGGGEG